MLNFQGAVHQDSVLLTHAPPLGWVSFPRKTWVSFNYKSILVNVEDTAQKYEGSLRCTYDNERKVFFSAVNLVCRYDRT